MENRQLKPWHFPAGLAAPCRVREGPVAGALARGAERVFAARPGARCEDGAGV